VPILIKWPAWIAAPPPREVMGHIDVMPSILNVLGVDPDLTEPLEGTSAFQPRSSLLVSSPYPTSRWPGLLIVSPSEQVRLSYWSTSGDAADRIRVLSRGVDLVRYRPGLDRAAWRRRLRLEGAFPVILSPRYQVDEALYNHDIVIEGFAAFQRRVPAAVCVQLYETRREAGRARLAKLAAARGLGDAYRLVPAVDNATMPMFYNLADAVVSIPSSDGFPVTVLEASACGAPMVVSDLPFCAEWFQHGVNGLVVPVRDAEAVCAALSTLFADDERRRSIGGAGRRLVEARADARRCMDELEGMYRELLASAAARKEVQNVWDLRALQR